MNQQMLVPLDGSVLAEVVMPHAAALARASSAELILLQVIAPSELRETSGWGSVPAHIRAGWVETALAQVQTSLEAVAEPGDKDGDWKTTVKYAGLVLILSAMCLVRHKIKVF